MSSPIWSVYEMCTTRAPCMQFPKSYWFPHASPNGKLQATTAENGLFLRAIACCNCHCTNKCSCIELNFNTFCL